MIIDVTIKNKQAFLPVPAVIVCGNKDYKINFSFDEEWEERKSKTARFFSNGKYEEVIFTGNICDVPVLSNTTGVFIGVFSGDIYTTTPAYIPCDKSILCLGGAHAEPPKDVYNQIIELINELQLEKGKPSNDLPLMDGEASAGSNIEYSRADHIHPTDTTRASAKDLTEETERATAAEEANATAITEETERATAAEEANATAIAEEVARATAAEEANAKAIADEVARATAAEQALTNIITEEVARQDEDIANATKTANEAKTTADTLDSTIQFALSHSTETREQLNAEIENRISADNANSNAIKAEETRAVGVETNLRDNLNAFIEEVRTILQITEEEDAGLARLQQVINYAQSNKDLIDEITINKVSVSDIVDHLLSLETSKPLSANQGRILKELIDALQTEFGSFRDYTGIALNLIDEMISNEKTRAETAEGNLDKRVTQNNTLAQNALDVATSTMRTAESAYDQSKANETNLNNEITRATQRENAIETALNAHKEAYTEKVAELEQSILDEESRAEMIEEDLADRIAPLEETNQKVLLNRDIALTNGSKGLEYRINRNYGYATCIGIGNCTDTNLEIASMVMGIPVVSIDENAFNNQSMGGQLKFTKLYIPEGINSIGVRSFFSCPLEEVTIMGGGEYVSIGYEAFGDTGTIKHLILGCREVEVEQSAFDHMTIQEIKYVGTEEDWQDYVYGDDRSNQAFWSAPVTYNYNPNPPSPYGNIYTYE